jgi:hypothetical protein
VNIYVVIGRFQCPFLHDGYKALLDKLLKMVKSNASNEGLILIGTPESQNISIRDKYPYPREIIHDTLRNFVNDSWLSWIEVDFLPDYPDDKGWCEEILNIIKETYEIVEPTDNIIFLYGEDSASIETLRKYLPEIHSNVSFIDAVEGQIFYHSSYYRNAIIKGDTDFNRSFKEGILYALEKVRSGEWSIEH